MPEGDTDPFQDTLSEKDIQVCLSPMRSDACNCSGE